MDSLTKVFDYKKHGLETLQGSARKDDIDYIVEVIREMAYILIDEDKDFDIVIKLTGLVESTQGKPEEIDNCLTNHDYIPSDVVVNRSDIIVDSV
jgi:hypothetical protein